METKSLKAPGKFQVDVKIDTDDNGMKRAYEIADELVANAERIETAIETLKEALKKASSLVNELADCESYVEVNVGDPIYSEITEH